MVEELKNEDIFAKIVGSQGKAFHSSHMQAVKERMLNYMLPVIPNPKPRSKRWLSTAIPESEWNSELAKTCSAAYQVNNAMSQVLFYEALQKIPENAVTVEVAPHALMASVLRRSLPRSVTNIGLGKAKHENDLEFFLQAIGKLYQTGLNVAFQRLYPRVTYPVPKGTPSIGNLMKWDHSQEWPVVNAKDILMRGGGGGVAASCVFHFDPFQTDSKDKFLLEHVIDGRCLFPFTGHLVMAWRAICKLRGLDYLKTEVVIDDVNVYRPTIVSKAVKFDVMMLTGNGTFNIMEGDSLAASGRVTVVEGKRPLFYRDIENTPPHVNCERIQLNTADIYKEFLLRGYEYGSNFRGILRSCNSGDRGTLYWTGNWITFLDSLLQTALLVERGDTLRLPVRLRYLRINPQLHMDSVVDEDGVQVIHLRNDLATKGCMAGGVEVCDLTAQTVPRRLYSSGKVILEKCYFVKNHDDACLNEHLAERQDLETYTALCRRYIGRELNNKSTALQGLANIALFQQSIKALKGLPPPDQDMLDACMTNSKCVLVQAISKILELDPDQEQDAYTMNVANLMRSLAPSFSTDKLWASGWSQRPLKPLLDSVMENTAGHRNRCLMLEPTDLNVVKYVRELQLTHPLIELDWCLAGPKVAELDAAIIDVLEARTLTIDFEAGDFVPESAKGFDNVFLDRVLSRKTDIPRYLHKVKELFRDDACILVNEVTKEFDLAFAVEALQNQEVPASGDGSRIYGKYLSHHQWVKLFEDNGFQFVQHQTDPSMMTTLYMIRKVPSKPRNPHFISVDDVNEFSWIEPLQQTIEKHLNDPDTETIWVTNTEVTDNGVVGLGLCLREESTSNNRFRVVTDISLKNRQGGQLSLESTGFQKRLKEDLHANCYRDGDWGSIRHLVVNDDQLYNYVETEHAFINTLSRGDLSSLTWVESSNKYWKVAPRTTPTSQLLSVYYGAINFRDVMLATGRLPPDSIPGNFADRDCLLGMEFSGRRTDNGKRVMGMLSAQALATSVVIEEDFSWDVPDPWTLEQAATVPIVYCTAYYALVVRGKLRRGERVLIHSGSGGVGQAAIAVALSYDCEVFTTVSSEEKKSFLQQRFPQLQDKHFANSRTTEFEARVRQATKGKGVNLVLNSLSDEKLQASVRCISTHGRFLEIGKFDLSNNSKLGMAIFLKNITFHGILLDSLFDGSNNDWQLVAKHLQDGIYAGVVQPLPSSVFTTDKAEEAFRFMASGKHIGKVLMQIRPEESEKVIIPRPMMVKAACRTICHPRHVYLITGGLGGFGLQLASWLISRGATKLVLTSRSGIKSGYQARCIYFWRRTGISIHVSTLDISDARAARQMLEECQEMGPLGGVFHLAMVLRDCLFENQNQKNFQEAAAAKYYGTKNLDRATREMCGEELKWFVMFSSITSGRGNAGQTNYGWANSTMERVNDQRRADNLPSICIQWGAIGDVGVILDSMGDNDTIVGGTYPQRMPSYIRADTGAKKASAGVDVAQAIAHILGVSDVSQLDPNANLGDLGLDSLMGVEIKQTLERDHDIVLSMKDIRNLTLNKLKEMSAGGGGSGSGAGQGDTKDQDDEDEEMAKQMEQIKSQMLSMFKLRIDVNDLLTDEKLAHLNDVTEGPMTFFVHSIEGIGTPLVTLAEKLTVPAYCFQSVVSCPQDTIENLADFYLKVLQEKQPNGPYRLVGYSYGATIAFEMATKLQSKYPEDKNIVESLILLDGSHHYMQTYKRAYRLAYGVASQNLANDTLFESELLCAWTLRFANVDYPVYRAELLALPSWNARVQKVVDTVMETGLFNSAEITSYSCNGLRKRFLAADRYDPKQKFNGNITLIRAEQSAGREIDVGRDYGIGTVATGEVEVHVVEGDHDTFIQGASSGNTAQIIMDCIKRAHSS